MNPGDRIAESAGSAKIVSRSDVVVVGGGPAGFDAASAARREGGSGNMVERYAYPGGRGAGGRMRVM